MDKWSKYEVKPATSNVQDRWSKYEVKPATSGDSWPALLGKSTLKGVTSLGDLPRNIATLGEGANNLLKEGINYTTGSDFYQPTNYSDYIPALGSMAHKGLSNLTGVDLEPHPSSPEQEIASYAAEFAGGAGPFGAVGKGAKLLDRFKKAGALSANAAGVGAVSGELQQKGFDPLVGDLVGMAALNPKAVRSGASAGARYIAGLDPKSLKLKPALAARELGIDLPNAVLTDRKATKLANETLSKVPYFGDRIKNKYKIAQEQTKDTIERLLENIGPARTAEIDAEIANRYDKTRKMLPAEARIIPKNTIDAVNDIKLNTALLSPEETALQNQLNTLRNDFDPKLKSNFGNAKIPLQEADVARLVGTKRSLNSIIDYDTKDKGVKNLLKGIKKKGIDADIAAYGELNPAWYKEFKDADNFYKNVAKRESVEKLLEKGYNPALDEFSYNRLAKDINSNTSQKKLARILGKDSPNFKKIKQLGELSTAMAQSSASLLNPSGTATTGKALVGISSAIGAIMAKPAILLNPKTLVGAGISGGAMESITQLLTNKKFLDSAIDYASKPTNLKGIQLNKISKKTIGYSLIELNKMLGSE